MALCGKLALEEALDLSQDRILNELYIFATRVTVLILCDIGPID